MKERMKLEKAKKNCQKITSEKAQEPKDQHKRKNQKDGAGQKKKRKSDGETLNDGHKDQKAKERKEKRKEKKKKKVEEQTRQNLLQEARKKQAAERWSSTSPDQSASFVPVPIHRGNNSSTQLPSTCSSAPSRAVQQTNQLSAHPPRTAQYTTPTPFTTLSTQYLLNAHHPLSTQLLLDTQHPLSTQQQFNTQHPLNMQHPLSTQHQLNVQRQLHAQHPLRKQHQVNAQIKLQLEESKQQCQSNQNLLLIQEEAFIFKLWMLIAAMMK